MEPGAPEGYYCGMNAARNVRRLVLSLGFLAVLAALLAPQGRALATAPAVGDAADDTKWSSIKNDTYEQRDHFESGAARLLARLEEQIRILKAKRATMTTDTKDWDLAIKEVDDSRSYLTACLRDVAQAMTPETWSDRKDKVGDAWRRSQLAVDKMHSTVTD